MFKIAFPWAKQAEEKSEREYLRSHNETSADEVAGNLWISPELGMSLRIPPLYSVADFRAALELAQEYKMLHWVRALLDPEDIPQNTSKSPSKSEMKITPPPKFDVSKIDTSSFAPPPSSLRTRSLRSASPSKSLAAKKATPRKRATRAHKETDTALGKAAGESLQSTLDAAASIADTVSVREEEVIEQVEQVQEYTEANGDQESDESDEETVPIKKSSDRVRINVESETTVDTAADLETSRTKVTVEMPNGLPELPLPEDTEEMIAKAKEMVDEAVKLQEEQEVTGNPSKKLTRKRKVEETVEEGEEVVEEGAVQPPKKARLLEARLRRERVRNRALIGVTATLAIA